MSFFRKSKQNDAKSEVARPRGRFLDVEEAEKLISDSRWEEAQKILDKILEIPDDLDAAANHLQEMLKDKTPIHADNSKTQGRDRDGTHRIKIRLEMGGGCVPTLMDLRARCLVGKLSIMFERIGKGPEAGNDPEIENLVPVALQHAQLTGMLLHDYPDPLFRAGLICALCAQFQPAIKFLERVVELEPANEAAKKALSHVKSTSKHSNPLS